MGAWMSLNLRTQKRKEYKIFKRKSINHFRVKRKITGHKNDSTLTSICNTFY
uniref:Uncharacterized protein n=1 Tax=Anguilla anguilla TaxID=7936 RepID=A0A0E9T5L5_ANGAN